jgi:signal transduction histidine kinase
VLGVLHQPAMSSPFPFRMRHADGTNRLVEGHVSRTLDPSGDRVSVLVARDITIEFKRESDRRQEARVETLGRLAAEVAHDVNNLLHAMTLHLELVDDDVAAGRPPSTEPLKRALETAADLTSQLLAYTRGGDTVDAAANERRCDAHALINRSRMLLRTLARRTTRLAFALDAESSHIAISPNELMQILVNLVANARDAMPDGGRLAIATRNVTAGCQDRRERFPLGALAIEVTDTGTGMAPDVKARMFEPFFTTKSPEQGTGLGLATVQQIIERSGGCVEVETAPGVGTTVRILLPPAPHTTMLQGVSAA